MVAKTFNLPQNEFLGEKEFVDIFLDKPVMRNYGHIPILG